MANSVVHVPEDLIQAIRTHGEKTYPHECCGILLGKETDQRRIFELIPADNTTDLMKERRYLIPPEIVLQAEKEARNKKMDVVGFYHSHPDHPAQPSEFDRAHAWPWYSYIIVSIQKGHSTDIFSWQLQDDRSHFVEEIIESL